MIHKILLSFLLIPVFLKGFGNAEILEISVLCLISYLLYLSHAKWKKGALLVAFIMVLTAPSLIHLWTMVSLLLVLDKRTWGFAAVSSALPVLELLYVPSTYCALTLIFGLGLILNYLPQKITWICNLILASMACCTILFDISRILFNEPIEVEKFRTESVYAPSQVFCKTTNTRYSDGEARIMRSMMFSPETPNDRKGVVVHEIETIDTYGIHGVEIWQQPVSWHHNQLLGSQYMLEAISDDGGLYSNKGVGFAPVGTKLLSFPISYGLSQPLIMEHDGIMHLHDSDYTSSYIANYQRSLNNEIVQNGLRPILIRIISFLASLLCIFILLASDRPYPKLSFFIFALLLSTFILVFICPRKGEIRITGKITNSHENYKADGVPKNIVDQGYDYTLGSIGAKVLVVRSGSFAIWMGEPLVVLEPNAVVLYKTKIISSDNVPLGHNKNIADARSIKWDGQLWPASVIIGEVTFVSTGSPAKLSWKDYLK